MTGTEPRADANRLPGNPLIWVLILSEIAVFTAALAGFAVARLLDPGTFRAGAAALDPQAGSANTAILLTSGLLAARALDAARQGRRNATRLHLAAAGLLGAGFIGIKIAEYVHKAGLGLTIDTDAFFTLYYLVTGFHLAHVAFGVGVLALVAAFPQEDNVESGVAFWHMVDLIWVMVFPVFYLLR